MSLPPRATIKIRILHEEGFAMGPGKAALLEAIAATRSIAGAGRALGLSYWKTRRLLDEMNHCFTGPLVTTAKGGAQGGGARVTETGMQALALFRAMEAEADAAIARSLGTFQDLLRP